MPNNRQLSLIIIAAALVGFALMRKDVRQILGAFLRDLTRVKRLLSPVIVFLLFVGALTLGGCRVGLWDSSLTTDTAFWILATGFALFLKSHTAIKEPQFFRRNVSKLFGWAVLVEFLVGLTTGPLWFELLLAFFLTPIVIAQSWSENRNEHRKVASCFGWLLVLIGFTMLSVSIWPFVTDFDDLDKANLLQQAVLPVWLTSGILPFVYLFGVYMHYETVSIRIGIFSESSPLRQLQLKLAVFREYGLKAMELDELLPYIPQVARTKGYTAARDKIREIQEELARKQVTREEAAKEAEEVCGDGGLRCPGAST